MTVTLGASGRWCLPPLSPDWLCALEAASPAAPGTPSARRPPCPSVTGLPREPSAGPSRLDCLDCAPQEGTWFLSGKLLQPPHAVGGGGGECLAHVVPGMRRFRLRCLGPTPQGLVLHRSPVGWSLEPLRLPGVPPFVRMPGRPLLARGFPGGLVVMNPPALQKTWVRSLGQKDALEEEMATHSSVLAWRIPWTEEPGGLQPMGSQEPDTTT